jgi:hypothetical protein
VAGVRGDRVMTGKREITQDLALAPHDVSRD